MIGLVKRIRKSIKRNKDGGIEGLPLQLMVMVLVAGLGTSVILGWMGSIEAPQNISTVHCVQGEVRLTSMSNGFPSGSNIVLTIFVADQDGNPISDAIVMLSGANVKTSKGETVYGRTGADGKVAFTGLTASLIGSNIGYITVTVTKAGYSTHDSTRIPVIK
ncbi:MAG: carboxypeptidase-like regulatory domain-containing protein [Candidatus Methanomethylophilaceae archaeon]|nr:carboxypeptidase-like regulatory domain-containing protein [Candidatus Methanomethylophilaceae archaeon]